MTPEELQ
jgi:hypothetical protein